ncbi:hypothetical protein [Pseudactinotalea terrae]|uniref:hypothetical protein n=1 Tax=Pseudactinotalea terrae TaxID=1743262 RepID=UPI0012E32DEF|nr:hypothetical protein [Pseudactinotalea terrae]
MSRRRGRRLLGGLLASVLLLAAVVGGVVLLLRSLDVGLPTSARCTASVDGASASLSPEQTANAALISAIAVERGLPARAVTIALATAMQESRLENIDYGDRDSIGLFQQRPSQGWGTVEEIMDPVYSTNTFYDALVEVEGYETMEITVAAQTVQRSGFPDAYAQHESMARLFASALTGWSGAALACELPEQEASIAVVDLLARDLGSATAEAVDGATVLRLDGDPDRSGWVLAHWAVATAELTGVQQVTFGDLLWTRSSDEWATAEVPAPAGTVTVR